MKRYFYFLAIIILFSACKNTDKEQFLPAPTDENTFVKEDMENPVFKASKKEWKKKLFRTPEGVNAEDLERENAYERFKARNTKSASKAPIETFADGLITAEWKERGSKNQAGSVFKTAYDHKLDEVFLVSAGQQLWKGTLDGLNWEVVNQKARFDVRFIEVVYKDDGSRRLVSSINREAHFSDDDGETWTKSNSPSFNIIKDVAMTLDGTQRIFMLGREVGENNVKLFVSSDLGESFESLFTFDVNDRNAISMAHLKGTDEMYVLENLGQTSKIYKLNENKTEVSIIQDNSPLTLHGRAAKLVGSNDESGNPVLYTLSNYEFSNPADPEVELYKTLDEGETWINLGILPSAPWGVGIFVSSENPDFLMYGDVECYRSYDGGLKWEQFNTWGEYYGNVKNKLHADMMWFSDYVDEDTGEYFMLISNHGGISKLYEYDADPVNFSLTGLNVSQYYSVRTSEGEEHYIYAGSQDQGFQRGVDVDGEILDLGQAISGDYGHIQFTTDGKLWTVYPGGWVTFWPQPQNGGITSTFALAENSDIVWIPPLAVSPVTYSDQIYLAGGNIYGSSGSYLIKLEANEFEINASQFDYDFQAVSGGVVSSIAIGDEFEENLYVATSNGRFFYSNDFGDTWNPSDIVPGGHYLYGQVIIPSKLKPNKIYTGGNGYNGIPVMRSIDGGKTFENFSDGLPATVVLGMAMNEDESLLFAATTSGPYVCILGNYEWHSLLGEAAPDVVYWSVELVNNGQTARFGTYGRGIYDFNISNFVNNDETELKLLAKAKVYPNPVSNQLNIEWPENASNGNLLDINGAKIMDLPNTSFTSSVDVSNLVSGKYVLKFEIEGQVQSQLIVKQ